MKKTLDTSEQSRVFEELLEHCSQVLTNNKKQFRLFYTIEGKPITSFNELKDVMEYKPTPMSSENPTPLGTKIQLH